MYLNRNIEKTVLASAGRFPVIAITGPRQSGKTSLVKHLFPEKPYFNLEMPDIQESIEHDPRAFFNKLQNGAVIDEVQRLPILIRYIQGIVDENKKPGQFILTGSNQFMLINKINESLAGRVALLKLLPFELSELGRERIDISTDKLILKGFYPAVQEGGFPAYETYQFYYETYLERDLRSLLNIKDLSTFKKFIRLCAGRTSNVLNLSSLSNDTGISIQTVKSWLSILEASFILFLLPPWFDNIKKRLIKSPKIYFYDTGLASYLLGIENTNQLSRDPLRGNLFENMIVVEYYKKRYNAGKDPRNFFYRDNHGNEVDLVIQKGHFFDGVEIKSSQTFHTSFLKGLDFFGKLYPERCENKYLIYDGEDIGEIRKSKVLNFRTVFS